MIDMFFNVGLYHFLVLDFILFVIGIIGVIISRNMLRIIMSLFVLTTSVVLNFVSIGFYCSESSQYTNAMSLFILLISCFQIILALVIMYKIYQSNEYFDSEKTKDKEV